MRRVRGTTVLAVAYAVVTAVAVLVRPIPGLILLGLGVVFVVFRRVHAIDATAVLTVFVIGLTLLPARYVVPSLGAVGTPVGILALAAGYWWLLERFVPRRTELLEVLTRPAIQPVLVASAVYGLAVCLTFAVAFARPLSPIESNGATRQLIATFGLLGITALAADGIRSRRRFEILLNRLLNAAAAMAVIALIQFFTDFDPVTAWTLPGLTLNQDLAEVGARSVVDRVPSTTLHPIEFGALLGVMLPLALHAALFADASHRRWRWFRLGLIAFAIPLSVSRTPVIVLTVAILMMWTAWTWRRRINIVIVTVFFTMGMRFLVPGLLGTIRALFTNFGDDPSVQGRTADYGRIWSYVGERPWLGRGLGTFNPQEYFYVDNEVLVTLVTGGVVGLLALLILVATSAVTARQVFWHGSDEATRHLGAALAASIVGGFAGFLTFDALGFPTFAGTMFLLFGLAGALWRLEVAPIGRRYSNQRARVPARV